MVRCLVLVMVCFLPVFARATDVVDATGRTVHVPDAIAHVLPAGPPAALLLTAVAPDLLVGWPFTVPPEARALLPEVAASRPQIPRFTGREDVTDKIVALHPELILDYGDTGTAYIDAIRAVQQRTGIPAILLDGEMNKIPATLRNLGAVFHRQERAEVLARFSEALLSLGMPDPQHPRVFYARGEDGLNAPAPGTGLTEVFSRLGWKAVAPEGAGLFRHATIADVRALDPDVVVFANPAMRDGIQQEEWQTVRAVREKHVLIAPNLPFSWIEDPPSINRLLGLAWLSGRDPMTLAATFNAVIYGRTLDAEQLAAIVPH